MVRSRIPRGKRAKSCACGLKTIVDYNAWLQLTHHVYQFRGPPCLTSHIIIGKVKPHDIYFTIVGAQFAHLVVHIEQISIEVPVIVAIGRIRSLRVPAVSVVRVVVVVPVQKRKIETYFEPLLSTGVYVLSDEVSAIR